MLYAGKGELSGGGSPGAPAVGESPPQFALQCLSTGNPGTGDTRIPRFRCRAPYHTFIETPCCNFRGRAFRQENTKQQDFIRFMLVAN